MEKKVAHRTLAVALGILLLLLPLVPAAAQGGGAWPISGRPEVGPFKILRGSELSLYHLVYRFYWDMLSTLKADEESVKKKLSELGLAPRPSLEVNAFFEATFRAHALFLDIPPVPLGVSEEEIYEAQYRNQEREVLGLQGITLGLLRDLRRCDISAELWIEDLERRIRPKTIARRYGKGEYYWKVWELEKGFEAALRAELGDAAESSAFPTVTARRIPGETEGQRPGAAGFRAEVSIEPLDESGFLLKARIFDLATDSMLSGPSLRVRAGETFDVETNLGNGVEIVNLTGTVDAAAKVATYTVVIKRDGKALAEHTARVAL